MGDVFDEYAARYGVTFHTHYDPHQMRRSSAHIARGRKLHRDCVAGKKAFVRAEVRAHVELTKRGRTRAYKAAERASELAFKAAFERGCAWTRRSR